jgi:hypothetical protein
MRAALIAVVFLIAVTAGATQDESTGELQDRFAFVEKLLNDSSAALQVEESGNENAAALRAQAGDKYLAALEDSRSGDADAAAKGLAEAMRLMYAAVAATRPDNTDRERQAREFRKKRATVDALLSAHQRISKEKGTQRQHELLRSEIAAGLKLADDLVASDQPAEARKYLDAVYDEVQAAVMHLRDGDTLVR